MNLQDVGEFGLIKRIRKRMAASDPAVIQGIGDDVAVVKTANKALLITTDILIEGIHFERSWIDPYRLGKKALAVNLSDIAAMGGTPKYFLISLGLPKNLSLSFTFSFYRGLKDESEKRKKIAALAHSLGTSITRIGEILLQKEKLQLIRGDGGKYSPIHLGFEHFR